MNHNNFKVWTLINGLIGTIGGMIIFFGFLLTFFMLTINTLYGILLMIFILIIKLTILVLGIISAANFKKVSDMRQTPNILFIIGGVISLIPILGSIGGILVIIGGAISLFISNNLE